MGRALLPSGSATRKFELSKFKGVDFGSELGAVDPSRSPDCLNMISEQSGRPVKRFGYEKLLQLDGRINGIFRLVQKSVVKRIVHCGTKLFLWNEDNTCAQLYADMNDQRSAAFQMNSKLWILDGKALLRYDGTSVVTAQSVAYAPTTRIKCPPSGGGENYEPVNLLSNTRINEFFADGQAQVFQLDAPNISSVIKVEQLDANGDWNSIGFGAVDKALGKVTLTSAPPAGSGGMDNVRITFTKEVPGNAKKINQCTTGITWGLGGFNRLFVTGNPDFVNMDFASEVTTDTRNAPTYFPDTGYALAGQDNTKIIGYLRSGENLAILKEDNDQDATVFLRSASMDDGAQTVIFPTKTGIAGVGAVSPYCLKDLRDDHMFLSRQGVFAISANAVTSERYAQARSELVNKKLIREPNLEEAVAVECDGYLYIAVNSHVYVADASQRSYMGKSAEQYQYEWYYWENVPVRCWFIEDGRMLFGSEDGRICRFYNAKRSDSYNDDGQPIFARWTTPELAFDTYSRYKTLRHVYTKLNPYARSSVKIYIKEDGTFMLIDEKTADIMNFGDVDFNRFTFNTNTDVSVIHTKVKAKKIVTTQLKFENDVLGEAFGLYGTAIYYDLKSNVK